ncbi:MAG: adenylosuccinate lyase [Candidatus Bilamarchaeaceae archaeon]
MISPFEERYKTEINEIFDEKNKYRKWMLVEYALAKAWAKLGKIPKDVPDKIKNAIEKVRPERIAEIEAEIHHDLMAMVKALSEQAGDAGKYVHFGATSYDIEDTATALMFLEAIDIIEDRAQELCSILRTLALAHKKTVCIGRTHGQHAVPTTYGMKFALYYQDIKRNIERLRQARERIAVGKMSGAVGTGATFGKYKSRLELLVMKELGLSPAKITTQVIQRDRHAEVLFVLALFAASLEKIAKEIRNLQRTEILEISEPFSAKQVGSSTMPQKRNPHKCERVCSLARFVRANVAVALENIPLEHERDLTNSANERIIFSQSFIAVDYMLKQMIFILDGLVFYPENIKKNLELTNGLIMAERLMIYLTENGIGRQEAHEKVREAAQYAFANKKNLKDVVVERKIITENEAKKIFDYSTYIGEAVKIVENAVKD